MIPFARTASILAFMMVLTALIISSFGCRQPNDTDTVAPGISFTFPGENVKVIDDIATIRVEARDSGGIKRVVFMAEGDTLAGLAAEPYVLYWNTTAYPDCTGADSFVLLVASAEDIAGNKGSTHREFYLDNEGNPPIPVKLYTPTAITKHSVKLSWERSVDYDFSHYLLRRGTTADVTDASDTLVLVDDSQTTSYTDQGEGVSDFGLLEDTDYYYRVWIYDRFDSFAASDSVVTARTLLPRPVTLSATSTVTKYKVGLEWEPNAEDVASYRLHRGLSAQQSAPDSIAGFPPGTHSYLDTGRTANTAYFYYLYLFDEAGYTHTFRSDDVLEVRTLALPPPELEDQPLSVTKYTAAIAWKTVAEQEDSSWVDLYRGAGASVDSTDILLYAAPRNEAFTYTDSSLQQDRTYRYRLRHRDSRDNSAWSNTLTLTTQSLADVWSGGLGISSQGKYQLDLTWDRYSYAPAADFAGYTLSRDGQVIFANTTADSNRHADKGLAKNTTYHYRLEVADTSGASLATTLEASTRDIFPAEIVSLEPTIDWFFRVAWLPSQESDSEFDRYELLRSNDTTETFADFSGDNSADCLLSGNCVRVATFPQRWPSGIDTLTYLDTDTTLVIITPVDTTLVDTTLPIYNYVVLTYDRAGEYIRSNIVGDTLYSSPSPVTLSGPSEHGEVSDISIKIQWNRASWPSPGLEALLFSRYEVWRFGVSGERPWEEGESDKRIHTADQIGVTTFSDGSAEVQGAFWYYVVVVRDIFGQGAASNVVEGFTKL